MRSWSCVLGLAGPLSLATVLAASTVCSRLPRTGSRPVIAVSIPPQKTLVRRLVGDRAEVLVLIPAGSNPSVFEPDARRTLQLSRARLYFKAGVPFEQGWLPRFRATNPALRIVDVNAGIPVSGHDPHTWLSPPLVRRQVAGMTDVLVGLFPTDAEDIRRNSAQLTAEISDLHAFLESTLGPKRGRSFVVMHPSWNYFSETYHLRMLAIEREGREPGPAHLAKILREARALGIRTVFAQPEYDQRPARVVAGELGGRVVNVSVLDENWDGMLRRFASTLAVELR